MTAIPKPSRDKVRIQRERLRAIQIWVPDVRSPEFAAEARRQSLLVSRSPHEDEEQAFINAVSIEPRDDEE